MKREYIIIEREWTETLQGAELLLYAYIKMTCDNCRGVCECSKANLSRWTGVGERWLNKPLESLERKGLITTEKRAGKYTIYKANPYTKSVPPQLKCTPTLKVRETPAVKVYPPSIINNRLKNKEKSKTRAYAQVMENQNLNSRGETPADEWRRLKAQTEREQAQRDAQQEVSAQDREQVILMQKEWRQKHKLTN